jgi:hypothetical protein
MEMKLVEHARRELTDLELEEVSAGRDYNLGFGIHLFVMGNYSLVYTDAKAPVVRHTFRHAADSVAAVQSIVRDGRFRRGPP